MKHRDDSNLHNLGSPDGDFSLLTFTQHGSIVHGHDFYFRTRNNDSAAPGNGFRSWTEGGS